jgi:Transglycosylase SLT domain
MMQAMRFFWLLAALLLALPNSGRAGPVPLQAPTQGLLCRAAVAAAERNNGIPPHLLAAIARVESGRRDPITGDWHPWPWTLDVEGEGAFYSTKAQAVAAVQAAQARGVRSIDVGCAQINLLHHPNAFASLDIALDPQANANYAAQFLKELYGQSGDWAKAAAAYHSATPEIGAEYQRKVLAVLPEEMRLAGTFSASASASPLSRSWSATLTGASPGNAPVLRAQPSGMGVAARTIMQPTAPGGTAPAGRSLAAYRSAPIALAFQPPVRKTGL